MKVFETKPNLGAGDLALWRELFPLPSVFLDIETMGLSKNYAPVYLVGLLYQGETGPVLVQYLAENLGDERAMLLEALDKLSEFDTVITFNGDAFDLPFLEYRAKKLRLHNFPKRESVDLYRRFGSLCKDLGLENRKLKTLEEFLGIAREDCFTGGQLIDLYDEYGATGDKRLEQVILLHNFEDVANMPALLRLEGFAKGIKNAEVNRLRYLGNGVLDLGLEKELPLVGSFPGPVALNAGPLKASFMKDGLNLLLEMPVTEGSLRFYLPTYKDYYYLPEQGKIVHASLAGPIPMAARRKAKACECYLVKKGRFLEVSPALAEAFEGKLHAYREDFGDKRVCFSEEELVQYLESEASGSDLGGPWDSACGAAEERNLWIRKLI